MVQKPPKIYKKTYRRFKFLETSDEGAKLETLSCKFQAIAERYQETRYFDGFIGILHSDYNYCGDLQLQ